MTGGQTSTREKLGSVFFAFLMVTSMVAVGMAGFAGTAAADDPTSTPAPTDNSPDVTVSPGGTDGVVVQNLTFDDGGGNQDANITNATISMTGTDDAADIDQLTFINRSSGQEIATGQVGEVVDLSPNLTVPDGGTEELIVTADLNTSEIADDEQLQTQLSQVGAEDTGTTFNSTGLTINGATVTYDTGSFSVNTFDQANKDEAVNVNVTVNTPAASANGVNETSITLSADNSGNLNDQNILLVENGELTDNVTDVNTNFDDGGNVTIDVNAELPEDIVAGAYQLNVDSAVTDDGGNQIQATATGGTGPTTSVDMAPAKLEVESDAAAFANADGSSPAANNENATVNVTVVDQFGNVISDTGETNATVSLTSNDNSVSTTSLGGDGVRDAAGSPIQFNVTNTEAGDVTLNAYDTDASDSQLNSGSATQTFVGAIEGVEVTTNKSTLVADGTAAAQAQLQLVDGNGNPVAKSGVDTSFSFNNATAAGLDIVGSQSPTTDSSGVATVDFRANNKDVTIGVTGFEQQTANQYNDDAQVTTVAGNVDSGNTNFYFNGNPVNGDSEDVAESDGVKVNTDHDVAVEVQDPSGNTIQDRDVSYTLNGNEVATATSDSNGFANTTITLPTEKGDYTLNASVDSFNASATSDAQVNITSVAENASQLAFTTDNGTVPSQSTTDVTVEVQDEFNNVNSSYDEDITVESSDVSVIDFGDGVSSFTAAPSDSGSMGEINATIEANATSGSADITATSGNLTEDSSTWSIGSAQDVDVTFAHDVSTSSNAQTTTTMYAQLLDSNGDPIAIGNENVQFARQSGNAAELDQSASDFAAQTNSTGMATFQVNATSNTGDTTFYANSENFSAEGTGTVTTTGPADSIVVEPETATAGANTSVNITAYYADSEGRMVPQTTSFDIETDLGNFEGSSAQTVTATPSLMEGSGASAQVTLNSSTAGTASINAIGAGVTGSAEITIEADGSDGGDGGNLADYTNDSGVVDATGLQDAAADFRGGNASATVLQDAAAAFRSGDPVS